MHSDSHRTDIELVAANRRDGDSASREQLVMRHAGLVRSIARRYNGRGLAQEDIEQTGYLGLIQAVDRYDPSRGVPLRAYAARTIEGEIMHLFRDRGWAVRVPRSLQEMSRRVASVRERLGHKLGPVAVAAGAGRGHRRDRGAGRRGDRRRPCLYGRAAGRSRRQPPSAGTSDGVPPGRVLATDEVGFTAVEDRDLLERAMRSLPARERRIVGLRVYHDLTQAEIAARTGISQMHVSRLLRASLDAIEAEIDATAIA